MNEHEHYSSWLWLGNYGPRLEKVTLRIDGLSKGRRCEALCHMCQITRGKGQWRDKSSHQGHGERAVVCCVWHSDFTLWRQSFNCRVAGQLWTLERSPWPKCGECIWRKQDQNAGSRNTMGRWLQKPRPKVMKEWGKAVIVDMAWGENTWKTCRK